MNKVLLKNYFINETNLPGWIIHILRGLIFPGKPDLFSTCIYIVSQTNIICVLKTILSEVGFEPTPTYVDQNAPFTERDSS